VVVGAATAATQLGVPWHSMRLLSDARHSTLPLLPLPLDPHEHPQGG
jgi:putative flavoprotein involved in K+ transport